MQITPDHAQDRWLHWLADLEGSPISFVTNLAFKDDTQRDGHDLVVVEIRMHSPDDHEGMGAHHERDAITDAFESIASSSRGAVREVSYTAHRRVRAVALAVDSGAVPRDDLRASIRAALPDHEFEVNAYRWAYYDDWFFPRPSDFRWASDAAVVDRLAQQGDLHHVPRRVDHWVSLPTRAAAERAIGVLRDEGFEVSDPHRVEDEQSQDRPWSVRVHHETSVETNTIFRHTTSLTEIAERFQGEYDGWETHAVTDPDAAQPGS